MTPQVIIETPRLVIRPPKPGDAKPLNDAVNRSLPTLQRWMPWASDPSLKTTEEFIQKSILEWSSPKQQTFPMIVELKSTEEIICASGFNEMSNPDVPYFDIGYWIDAQHMGKGYVTECVNALTHFAFNKLHAVRVQIRTQKENLQSIAVAKRCGFQEAAILKNAVRDCKAGLPCDGIVFARFDASGLPDLWLKLHGVTQ